MLLVAWRPAFVTLYASRNRFESFRLSFPWRRCWAACRSRSCSAASSCMGFLKVAGLLLAEKTLPAMTTLGSILCRRLQKLASLVHGLDIWPDDQGPAAWPARPGMARRGTSLLRPVRSFCLPERKKKVQGIRNLKPALLTGKSSWSARLGRGPRQRRLHPQWY